MALILYEGFDTKATADLGTIFNTVGPANTITQNGRDGGRALTSNYQNGDLNTKNLATAVDTVVFGFAVRVPTGYAVNSTAFPFLALNEGTTRHIGLLTNANGNINAYMPGTGQTRELTGRIEPNTWYYVEGKFRVHDTAGFLVARVNGVQTASHQNIDTRNGGTGLVNRFQIFPGLGQGSTANYMDDLYVLDTTGTENNDFLGDQRILNGATAPASAARRPVVFVAT